ncbi:MAG: DNA polymerase IV [Oscillospiraceae bacterium]|nr:DNA polymerase IV [Oscillospiraceae bacterium]
MDDFYASVETRDNPALRGKPLIIGSLPGERVVVATCSYEARKFGVHSAMNIKEAYRLCPNGIYMHPNMEKYKIVSGQLHEIWNSYATALEAIAFDEAYLDVTESAKNFEVAGKFGHEIKRRVHEELGLSCSVGVAYSKTAAKTASEENKPGGYFEIPTAQDYVNLIIDRDVRELYTVGEMTAKKLYASGIHTVRDIQEKQETVIRLLGKQGQWITQLTFYRYGIVGSMLAACYSHACVNIGINAVILSFVIVRRLISILIFLKRNYTNAEVFYNIAVGHI